LQIPSLIQRKKIAKKMKKKKKKIQKKTQQMIKNKILIYMKKNQNF